jgi:UDP-N-acetyl-D-mannosaminuronic acid dehydrogenase
LSITRKISLLDSVKVISVEPNISELKDEKFELVSIETAAKCADIGVLLVDHAEFKALERPSHNFVIDTKGIWT